MCFFLKRTHLPPLQWLSPAFPITNANTIHSTACATPKAGLLPLAPEVGVEALRQLLFCASAPVVMVCPLDVARLPAVPYFSALRPSGAAAPVDSARGGTVGALPGWLAALEAGNQGVS